MTQKSNRLVTMTAMYSSAGERLMVAIYLATGEESMAAEVVHNNQGGLLLLPIIMILFLINILPTLLPPK